MRHEDDDEADAGSGPPPDPSVRAWRHPSELAAAAAAANRAPSPPPLRSRPIGPVLATVALTGLAATVVVGLGVLTASVGPSNTTDLATEGVGGEVGDRLDNPSALLAGGPLVSSRPDGTDDQATSTTDREASSPSPAPASPSAGDSDDAHPASSLVAPTSLAPAYAESIADPNSALEASDGVYLIGDDTTTHLAAFTVVDRMVFTSAAALAGHQEVSVVVDQVPLAATVAGHDPYTDVAVLTLSDHDLHHLLTQSVAVWEAPEPPDLGPGAAITITIAKPDDPHQDAITGLVVSTDQPVTLPDGRSVYGVLVTNAYRPDRASGAPVVDANGELVGMVISSTSSLTSVLPVHQFVGVGTTTLEWGVPALAWLGIRGTSHDRGGAELTEVVENSPAHLAGLAAGDLITSLDSTPIQDWSHLVYLIRQAGVGAPVVLTVERIAATEPGSGATTTEVEPITVVVGSRLDKANTVLAPISDR